MQLMKYLIILMLVFLPVTSWSANIRYVLDVQINTKEQKITGNARIKADYKTKTGFSLQNLRNLKVDGKTINNANKSINLTLEGGKETLISYEAFFVDNGANFIDQDNVFLNDAWYPQPDILVEYALSVTLPRDFIATSEAEATTIQEQDKKKTFNFQFKHPLDGLHLAASTRYVLKKDRYKNITIEAYFFKEDVQLADTFIDYTIKYLKMYETMLTPYPYQRFAIVETIFPTGNSMPTFTMLGKQVVHLPFIVKTSLGHEILHEWFGNSVYIDFTHGNWAEGITTYLADHHYAALEDRDSAYRKQIMVDYDSYVNRNNKMPVSDFHSRSNRAQKAIGYGKTAMLFHQLRRRYGDKSFFAALRDFIQQNSFRKASWHDIQRAFEKVTGDMLYTYFGNWLTNKDIPQLSVEDAELYMERGQLKLNFTLLQQGEAYPLLIPITFYTESDKSRRFFEVKDSKEDISLTLDNPPTKVIIDENYDILRRLTPGEIPPVLANIMGKEKLTVVVSADGRVTYQPIIDALGIKNITYVTPADITFTRMKEYSFLIAGYDNSLIGMLFGKQKIPEEGVRLRVYKNPYNPAERIMLLHAKDKAEARAVRQKINHYGKYTELAFNGGKNIHKRIAETEYGVPVLTRPSTWVLKPERLSTLGDILPKLIDSRIIYVGEQHNQFAHHLNQLQIIKKLHETGYKLAVGMEMFQMPSQQPIDDYFADRIDERTFLHKSDYFSKWGYDYNLYKPIIDYLKQEKIPLVALNIEGDIIRKVAHEGIHSLTDEEKKQLPSALDLSNEQYRVALNRVFGQHGEHQKSNDFNYFLQAQILWDEGMAESAQQFLVDNPEHKLVILAGNGHMEHKYGIPERLYRRNHESYTVIVQDDDIEDGIADYILLTTEIEGREAPRLGVVVEEKGQSLVVKEVRHKSPAKKAGLEGGDIILQFAGHPIKSLADLKLALFYSEMGSSLGIQLKRDDKTLDKDVELFSFSGY